MLMAAELPICRLVRSRMTELGLSKWDLAEACGYESVSGGLKAVRLTLRTGKVHRFLAPGLPAALSIDQTTFDRAVETEWILAARAAEAANLAERQYRKEFCPHVWARFVFGSPKPNAMAFLGGIYGATYAFLPEVYSDSAAAMESGFHHLIQDHFQLWGPSMPLYGKIIGYYSVSEPAAMADTDLAVPRETYGNVLGLPRAIERPRFFLTKELRDPLSNWISHLDHLALSRF